MALKGFGDILKELREEKLLTQEQLAKAINVKRSSIAGYEAKKVSWPEFDTFIKIADYFNVSTDYLLGRTESRVFDGGLKKLTEEDRWVGIFIQKLQEEDLYRELVNNTADMDKRDMEKLCKLIYTIFSDKYGYRSFT